jgi:hypothetical protein
MTMRIFLGGVFGAIAMFLWSFVAHMVLPLGDAGIEEIPNEQPVVSALKSNMGDKPGFFIFPGPGVGPNATRAEQHAAMERVAQDYEKNASGLLIYHPPGRPFTFGKWLTVEFLTELLESLLAAFLLGQTALATFGTRVGFVTVLGVLAAVATNISYWNWYGFPAVYTAGYMCTQIVGFFCAGLVIALVLKNRALSAS